MKQCQYKQEDQEKTQDHPDETQDKQLTVCKEDLKPVPQVRTQR